MISAAPDPSDAYAYLEARYGPLIDTHLPGKDEPDVRVARLQLAAVRDHSSARMANYESHGPEACSLFATAARLASEHLYCANGRKVIEAARIARQIFRLATDTDRLQGWR